MPVSPAEPSGCGSNPRHTSGWAGSSARSSQHFRQDWRWERWGAVAHCKPAKVSFILSASCFILNGVWWFYLQGGECLVHLRARGLTGFDIQPVPGSVGSLAQPNFVLTLIRTCVWCTRCLLRPEGPWPWEQRAKQTLVWMCFIYINTQQEAFVLLPAIPYGLTACKGEFTAKHPALHVLLSCREHGRANTVGWALFALCDALLSRRLPTRRDFIVQKGRWPRWAGRDFTGRWDMKQWAKFAVLLSGIGFYFPKGVMTAEQWTREVGLHLKYTGGPSEPALISLLAR